MRAALRNISVGATTEQLTYTSAADTDWSQEITLFMTNYWEYKDVQALVRCVISGAGCDNDNFYIEMEEGIVSSTKMQKYTKKRQSYCTGKVVWACTSA